MKLRQDKLATLTNSYATADALMTQVLTNVQSRPMSDILAIRIATAIYLRALLTGAKVPPP